VHRDLKPENIMVLPPRGLLGRENVKLLDFGVAKLGDRAQAKTQKLTQHGMVLGTPGYMSPEQAIGQESDVRSDLYSCGVILYQMLTGQRPYEADSALQVLAMHLNAELRSLRVHARIPAAVDHVVLRAMAKRPEDRFQSARELRQALERAALARDGRAGVSGMEATMLASSPPVGRTAPRWIGFAIIVAAAAILIGNHLRPPAPGNARRRGASSSAPAAGDAPRKPPEAERPPPERPKPAERPKQPHRNVKKVRATAKKQASAKSKKASAAKSRGTKSRNRVKKSQAEKR